MEYTSTQEEQPTYRDLRSYRKALNRQRKRSQGHYGYQGVKPFRVGQKYYALALVPNKDSKTLPSASSTSKLRASCNKEIYDLSLQLRDERLSLKITPIKLYDKYGDWARRNFYYNNYIALCVAEARTNGALTHNLPTLLSLRCVLRNPHFIFNVASAIPANHKVVLAPETWTKQDDFIRQDVSIYPLCSRHHRSKKYKQKGWQKQNVKNLRRGTKCLDGERRERDEIAETRREWLWEEEQDHCCSTCIIHSDVDSFMEGEFQDPEVYQKAWDVLRRELLEERIAEGDAVWMSFYRNYHAEEGELKIETEVDFVEDNGEDSDACPFEDLTSAGTEHELDSWSEIVFISGTLAECDTGSHRGTEFDVILDADLSMDVEWEMLFNVDEIVWEIPRDGCDKR